MKLIIGLGNPGEKYKNNRHNVGFMVVDALVSKIRNPKFEIRNNPQILIFKSENFMNDSGVSVKKLINHYSLNINHLYVIHDDLDIPLGKWKIQLGKGPELHGGINSIEQELGTEDFWRIRVGVDNRKAEPSYVKASEGKDYVLEDFTKEEMMKLREVISEICKKLATS